LALVLLPTAIAIALLLRPVARQLRDVEEAAKAIAAGDLSARVDERRVPSTKTLARSFNQMASRTETVVRTQRELMQAVSHELRTPLSRIRFAIDLIGDAKNDAERQRRLSDLDDATEELDSLVGELLRYVRLETAELPSLEREIVAVRDVLEGVIPKYRALHGSLKFHIAIGGESKSDAPVTVFADRVGFQRALGNLLSNASRFASSEVVIHVTSRGGTTAVDIVDDGPGIPPHERERVFEPFVRLDDDSHTIAGRGVGLGLALVKRIVLQHGGRIEVREGTDGGCLMHTEWPNRVRDDVGQGRQWTPVAQPF
jgi:two-component system sensor histidine kinase RstB